MKRIEKAVIAIEVITSIVLTIKLIKALNRARENLWKVDPTERSNNQQ